MHLQRNDAEPIHKEDGGGYFEHKKWLEMNPLPNPEDPKRGIVMNGYSILLKETWPEEGENLYVLSTFHCKTLGTVKVGSMITVEQLQGVRETIPADIYEGWAKRTLTNQVYVQKHYEIREAITRIAKTVTLGIMGVEVLKLAVIDLHTLTKGKRQLAELFLKERAWYQGGHAPHRDVLFIMDDLFTKHTRERANTQASEGFLKLINT